MWWSVAIVAGALFVGGAFGQGSDACLVNPCENGGTCVPLINGATAYVCECRHGYRGPHCGEASCDPNPCLYGGVCSLGADGFECECPPCFGGSCCETEVAGCNTCPDPACTYGLTCLSRRSWFCDCHANNYCNSDKAFCVDGVYGQDPICRCKNSCYRWNPTINDCELDDSQCACITCSNANEVCSEINGRAQCVCDSCYDRLPGATACTYKSWDCDCNDDCGQGSQCYDNFPGLSYPACLCPDSCYTYSRDTSSCLQTNTWSCSCYQDYCGIGSGQAATVCTDGPRSGQPSCGCVNACYDYNSVTRTCDFRSDDCSCIQCPGAYEECTVSGGQARCTCESCYSRDVTSNQCVRSSWLCDCSPTYCPAGSTCIDSFSNSANPACGCNDGCQLWDPNTNTCDVDPQRCECLTCSGPYEECQIDDDGNAYCACQYCYRRPSAGAACTADTTTCDCVSCSGSDYQVCQRNALGMAQCVCEPCYYRNSPSEECRRSVWDCDCYSTPYCPVDALCFNNFRHRPTPACLCPDPCQTYNRDTQSCDLIRANTCRCNPGYCPAESTCTDGLIVPTCTCTTSCEVYDPSTRSCVFNDRSCSCLPCLANSECQIGANGRAGCVCSTCYSRNAIGECAPQDYLCGCKPDYCPSDATCMDGTEVSGTPQCLCRDPCDIYNGVECVLDTSRCECRACKAGYEECEVINNVATCVCLDCFERDLSTNLCRRQDWLCGCYDVQFPYCPREATCVNGVSYGFPQCLCPRCYEFDNVMIQCRQTDNSCSCTDCGSNSFCVDDSSGRAQCQCNNCYTPHPVTGVCQSDTSQCSCITCGVNEECQVLGGRAVCVCANCYTRNINNACIRESWRCACNINYCPSGSSCFDLTSGPNPTCLCTDPCQSYDGSLRQCTAITSSCACRTCPNTGEECQVIGNVAQCVCGNCYTRVGGTCRPSSGLCGCSSYCPGDSECLDRPGGANPDCRCLDSCYLFNPVTRQCQRDTSRCDCLPTPCGANSYCDVVNNAATCLCEDCYLGPPNGICTLNRRSCDCVSCPSNNCFIDAQGFASCGCEDCYEVVGGRCQRDTRTCRCNPAYCQLGSVCTADGPPGSSNPVCSCLDSCFVYNSVARRCDVLSHLCQCYPASSPYCNSNAICTSGVIGGLPTCTCPDQCDRYIGNQCTRVPATSCACYECGPNESCRDTASGPVCECETCFSRNPLNGDICQRRTGDCDCGNCGSGSRCTPAASSYGAVRCVLLPTAASSFLFMFIHNINRDNPGFFPLELYLSSAGSFDSLVTVETPASTCMQSQTVEVPANSVQKVDIPNGCMTRGTGIGNKTIEVRAAANVNLVAYAINKERYSADSFLIFPVESAGLYYKTMSWFPIGTVGYSTEFGIVALEDNTFVTLYTPTQQNVLALDYVSFIMNRYQTFQLQSREEPRQDLSGTIIMSDRAIQVYSGNVRAAVEFSATSRDHLCEQLPPVNTWGRNFTVVTIPGRAGGGGWLRLQRAYNLVPVVCTIYADDLSVVTVDFSSQNIEDYDIGETATVFVSCTGPIMCAHFVESKKTGEDFHDPAFLYTPPVSQFTPNFQYSLANFSGGLGNNAALGGFRYRFTRFLIVAKDEDRAGILINEVAIAQPGDWHKVPGPNNLYGLAAAIPTILNDYDTFYIRHEDDSLFQTSVYQGDDRESIGMMVSLKLEGLYTVDPELLGFPSDRQPVPVSITQLSRIAEETGSDGSG